MVTTEAQVQAYTIQGHGVRLARRHLRDWFILLLLVGIDVGLNKIDPFYRFVGKGMTTDLKYPFKPNTIPFWTVPIYAVLLPILIFLIRYLRRKDVHDLHHAVLGVLYAVFLTAVITDAIKDGVGRPRPNFFRRCFPNGKAVYDKLGGVVCTGVHSIVKEGHKSFPSGHTSLSFAGLGFLSLYMAAKIQAFDGKGHVGKLCLVFLPLLAAALVGVSRVDDYWHHWTDVFAGALLGLTVSFFCYLQFFPPPYRTKGWGTYSYFRALERESEPEPRTNNGHTDADVQATTGEVSHLTLVRRVEDHNITIE